MRNPFRFTFRPGHQRNLPRRRRLERLRLDRPDPRADDSSIDNFGWPCYEGNGWNNPAYRSAGLNLCTSLYNNPGSRDAPDLHLRARGYAGNGSRAMLHRERVLDLRPCLLPGRQLPGRVLGRPLLRGLLPTLRVGGRRKDTASPNSDHPGLSFRQHRPGEPRDRARRRPIRRRLHRLDSEGDLRGRQRSADRGRRRQPTWRSLAPDGRIRCDGLDRSGPRHDPHLRMGPRRRRPVRRLDRSEADPDLYESGNDHCRAQGRRRSAHLDRLGRDRPRQQPPACRY